MKIVTFDITYFSRFISIKDDIVVETEPRIKVENNKFP